MTIYDFAFMINEDIHLTYDVNTQRWNTVIKDIHGEGEPECIFAGDRITADGDTPINALNNYAKKISSKRCAYQGRIMNVPKLELL